MSSAFSATMGHIVLDNVVAERMDRPGEKLEVHPEVNLNVMLRHAENRAQASFTVKIVFPNPDKPVCKLQYTMKGLFELSPTPASDPDDQRAAIVLLTSLAWPYLREFAEKLFHDMRINQPVPMPYAISEQEIAEQLKMAKAEE